MAFIFGKTKFCVKGASINIRDDNFLEGSILRLLAHFGLCPTSKLYNVHSRTPYTFSVFYPKWKNVTLIKVSFSQKILHGFSEVLMEDAKLMLDKVLKVSNRYLSPYLSYRENPGGG